MCIVLMTLTVKVTAFTMLGYSYYVGFYDMLHAVLRPDLQYRSNATSHSHTRVRCKIDHPTLMPHTR